MPKDNDKKAPPKEPGSCTVSASSRVREPGEKRNETLTSDAYEMEILKAQKQALKAQQSAEANMLLTGNISEGPAAGQQNWKAEHGEEMLSLAAKIAAAEIEKASLLSQEIIAATIQQATREISREIRECLREALAELIAYQEKSTGPGNCETSD